MAILITGRFEMPIHDGHGNLFSVAIEAAGGDPSQVFIITGPSDDEKLEKLTNENTSLEYSLFFEERRALISALTGIPAENILPQASSPNTNFQAWKESFLNDVDAIRATAQERGDNTLELLYYDKPADRRYHEDGSLGGELHYVHFVDTMNEPERGVPCSAIAPYAIEYPNLSSSDLRGNLEAMEQFSPPLVYAYFQARCERCEQNSYLNLEELQADLEMFSKVFVEKYIMAPSQQYVPNRGAMLVVEQLAAAPQGTDGKLTEISGLALGLINVATMVDEHFRDGLNNVHFTYGADTLRNILKPAHVSVERIFNEPWAERHTDLPPGWQNDPTRATHDGTPYEVVNGRAINPYTNTGLEGNGCLGKEGPNNAVDFIPFVIRDDGLCFRGIVRDHDYVIVDGIMEKQVAIMGGFEITEAQLGQFVVSRAKELFEEMISGSVQLTDAEVEATRQRVLEIAAGSVPPEGTPEHRIHSVIARDKATGEAHVEGVAELKYFHTVLNDFDFIGRLEDFVAGARECYAGVVMGDSRNTNNRWIQTRVGWVVMEEENLEKIGIGQGQKYQFVAGDDAAETKLHRFDSNFIERAFASHSSFVCYAVASFLLEYQEKGIEVPGVILDQVRDVINHYREKYAEAWEAPDPSKQQPDMPLSTPTFTESVIKRRAQPPYEGKQ